MNGSSRTTQGHDENIQPTPHHLKLLQSHYKISMEEEKFYNRPAEFKCTD